MHVSSDPFAQKIISEGKLFRRKHGFKSAEVADGAEAVLYISVPYTKCKINMIELVNSKVGITVDFKVHDDPNGTYSGYPSYPINQFGFDAELPDGLYVDKSEYDADLYLNMDIAIVIKNNSGAAHTLRGNITYHEVVSV